uniref:Uncharacterized protein n=1 Tax=Trachysalambria curvirostris nimavirus TaxID=2984282 RepID=A0A9C7EZ35_9VIRU|nr:MAG: hypothetical protein [Trachysalambria curvirostris nimavirus]
MGSSKIKCKRCKKANDNDWPSSSKTAEGKPSTKRKRGSSKTAKRKTLVAKETKKKRGRPRKSPKNPPKVQRKNQSKKSFSGPFSGSIVLST